MSSPFIYPDLQEKLDIALGAFYQDNSHFIISAFSDTEEDLIQIIHRNMAEETTCPDNSFGIALNLSFDPEYPEDVERLDRFKQDKRFGDFIHGSFEGIDSYTLLLPNDSEHAAALASRILKKVMLNQQNIPLQFEIFESE